MARPSKTPDVIEEFEGAADRLAHWIGENAVVVILLLVLLLGGAGAWGGYRSWSRSREEAASSALEEVRSGYLLALGAAPGALEEPELANPEAAREIREQYVAEFQGVAGEHEGTVAGTLALFEAAEILEKLGRAEKTEETWRQALDAAGGNPGLAGLLHQRIAQIHESRQEWEAAAAAHEQAGELADYALRYWALLDAARCRSEAGDGPAALALYERVELEAPELELPPQVRAQLRELRAQLNP